MTSVSMQARLWYWQRATAALLGLCVLIHLGIMIFAVRGGLSAAEILGRTQGSWSFGAFYATFVLACAVHVPIGLTNIAQEWWGWRGRWVSTLAAAFGLVLLATGLHAVYGVIVR